MPRGPPSEQVDASDLTVRQRCCTSGEGWKRWRRPELSAPARPNAVEDGWVVGDHPALGYPTVLEPKDGDGPPLEALAAAVALACGEYDRALVVGEHPVDGDAECRVRQLASAEEVAQYVIPAAMFIRDRALTGHMPDDVIRQHRTRGVLLTARIEAILAVMKVADELRVWVLGEHHARVALTVGC
jgi:hypothetical protein